MIGFVRGILAHKEPPFLVIDVNGVGYEIEAPMSTIFRLPEVGKKVQLATHLVVREDRQMLFGFHTEDERRLFRNLIKVSGVGAKLALTILSGISVADFARCVQTEDKAALVRLPGIGRKTAERLILDMRDRIDSAAGAGAIGGGGAGSSTARVEAFNALASLGYRPAEIQKMLDKLAPDEDARTEDILRSVLRAVAP
ncbi:MAG: Holliday junction branch migration protein RuvA [Gammaproteobacteria bacterium]|nr:MAG: Holliday junction branch migration protein RuvA [Gammaproteobacteria bacterium]